MVEQYLKTCNLENEVEFRFRFTERNLDEQKLTFDILHHIFQPNIYEESTVYIGNKIKQGNGTVNVPDGLRLVVDKKGETFMTKISVKRAYMDKIFKLSESIETILPKFTKEMYNNHYITKIQRNRKRKSLINKNYRLDLTTVEEFNIETQNERLSYEVELEIYTKNKSIINPIITKISDCLYKYTKNNLRLNYNNLLNTKSYKFVGPFPRTLIREKFDEGILSCGYSVTDKADGERFHLYINHEKLMFIINRKKEYKFIGISSNVNNTIIDGELFDNTFYAFDILVNSTKDVRNLFLVQRLEIMGNVINNYKGTLKIKSKTFYFKMNNKYMKIKNSKITQFHKTGNNLGILAYELWKSKEKNFKYELDGLIFTPLLKPYYNNEIYKWKPNNTVDLYVRKYSKNGEYFMELQVTGIDNNGRSRHYPFSGVDKKGSFYTDNRGTIEKNKAYEDNEKGIIEVNKSTWDKFRDNSVIEFQYINNVWKPMYERKDKENANFITTFNDVWYALRNPVTLNDIKTGVFRSCIRPFHNEIKTYIINKYMKNMNVLDIGFGAGGDINKYVKAETKSVVALDIVQPKYTLPKFIEFIKVENDMYNVKKLVGSKKFDVINIQFAAHYFFRNREVLNNFITNLKENIKKNGIVVMTILNGNRVLEMLNGKNEIVRYCDKQVIFKMKIHDSGNSSIKQPIGKKLEVSLFGTAYFDKPSNEYIVPIDIFKSMMEPHFKLIKNKSFEEYSKIYKEHSSIMCDAEKEYSFLNHLLVFKENA